VPDGAPVRFLLLGEQLIAFRDTQGRIGIMDHRCPHRCASLFFGRNEQNGIRCVYHGWKYDYLGNCVGQPNLPPHRQFKEKVHAKAYCAAERNGIIYVCMGDAARVPPLPDIAALHIPESEANISFVFRTATGSRVSRAISNSARILQYIGRLTLGVTAPPRSPRARVPA
jgi:phthalate 4,5-dioxygenase